MSVGLHDVLQAVGPQSAHILGLWRLFLGLCTAVTVLLVLLVLIALVRRRHRTAAVPADIGAVQRADAGPHRAVAWGVAASVLGLLLLIVASVHTDRALAQLSLKNAITIEVVGHQWWWTVRYLGQAPADTFETANEIHVPVGQPVLIQLRSDDVIHSLWVPSLSGKRDLIPGRTALMAFRADRPGVYEGRCAEFCGHQHAQMAFTVQAHAADDFDAWRQRQQQPAVVPSDAQTLRGQQLFESMACALCHTVQGTAARGRRGPDLTHMASRSTLGAGALPNSGKHLAAWIADPQRYKPGANMPAVPMAPEDLRAIVAYLGTLQ